MEGPKLDLSGRPEKPANYKAIPEADMEEEAVTRPKSLVKSKPSSPEVDGADEKMLPKEEKLEISTNEKQNGDAKLDIGEIKTAFVGLTKEELMKYANDPFWVRLRWFLFITFWFLWGMMLVGAIMIICAAPKCDPPPPKTWWEKGPLAEINADLDAEQLQELKDKKVTGVILSWPEDTYEDFDQNHTFIKYVTTIIQKEINVIVELEPGNSQAWFNQSENGDTEFTDYYIWRKSSKFSDNGTLEPPNNWLTVNSTSSWIYSNKRKEFYYAPVGRPHLNFRNPNVTETFSEVLKKFFQYGIGGVRLKGVPFLLVDPKFQSESLRGSTKYVVNEYGFYNHFRTEHLEDLGPLLDQWRQVVKNKTENGPFMAAEDLSTNIQTYRANNASVVDLPLQTFLCSKPNITVTEMVDMVTSTLNSTSWPLWKCNSTDALDIVTYLLPGTPLIQQNTSVSEELLKIRDSPSIMRGKFSVHSVSNGTIFAFISVTAGNPGILVALNPTDNRVVVDFPGSVDAVSEEVTVLLYSSSYNESTVQLKVKQDADSIPMSPHSAIVLSYVPKSN